MKFKLTIITALLLASIAQAYPPDNAAVMYYKTCLTYQKAEDQLADDLRNFVQGKTEPTEELTKYITGQSHTISTMTTASKIKNCDWGHNYAEGFDMIVPALADMRNITRIIIADAILNARQGKYETALDRCITVYRMARHVKDQVMINNLVAIAMEAMSHKVLINNVLPNISTDKKLLNKLKSTLADIAVEHNKLAACMKLEVDTVTKFTTPEKIAQTVIEVTGSDAKLSDYDKGLPAKGVAYYKEHVGRIINAFQLPYNEALAEIEKIEAKIEADSKNKPEAVMTSALVPAVAKCLNLTTRSDTDLNALRTAIDLYLTKAKTGKLPETLPAGNPKDLFSNKDFEYTKTKNTFTLTCDYIDQKTKKPRTYEFKIAK